VLKFVNIIVISVKQGKDSTRTLSLVINGVVLKKPLAKMYVSIQGKGWEGVVKLKIPSILVVIEFHPIFPFS